MTSLARQCVAVGLIIGAVSTASAADTDNYPDRPVRIIVPVGAGTASDLTARYFGARLGKMLNTSFVVENKMGAGGVIGTEVVARAAPDGYTLLLTFSAHYINQWVMQTPFDAVKDFEPIAGLNVSPLVLVTASNSPYQSVSDVISASKRAANSVSYGSAGTGGVTNMAGALFENLAGVQMTHVPYKSAGQVPMDAASGQIDVAFVGLTAALPLLKSGRLHALAVSTATRARSLPSVPTLAEVGLSGYDLSSKTEVFAPKGTPADIVAKLSDAFASVAAADEFKEFCQLQACEVQVRTGAEVKATASVELEKWKQLVNLTEVHAN